VSGWGNNPDAFGRVLEKTWRLSATGQDHYHSDIQDDLIDEPLGFQKWHCLLPTRPSLEVLDTRTRRWRSEMNLT
jgi:hypothetical protein